MSVHDGHRARLRVQFHNAGLDSFSDVQILELLLTYSIPRIDVNPLAHALLDHFGSLSAVLNAPPEALSSLPGIGESSALLLSMMPQLFRRYSLDCIRPGQILSSTSDVGRFLLPFFLGETEECVYMVCLSAGMKVLDCRKLFVGSVNTVAISIRKIVETALLFRASSVIIAHNHPAGFALPSYEDERTTTALWQALDAVGILLTDHIIVADGDYVSLADSRLSCFR